MQERGMSFLHVVAAIFGGWLLAIWATSRGWSMWSILVTQVAVAMVIGRVARFRRDSVR